MQKKERLCNNGDADFEIECYERSFKLFGTALVPLLLTCQLVTVSYFETGKGSAYGGQTVSSGSRKHPPPQPQP